MVVSITDKINKATPIGASVRDLNSGVLLIFPRPSKATYDPGETLGQVKSGNCQGVTNTLVRYTTEIDPKFGLTIARTSHVYGLKRNRPLIAGTGSPSAPIFMSDYQVPANGLKAAATSGYYGFGMAADTAAIAAYYLDDNNAIVPMVQGTYSTFDPAATPFGWAIGANFGLKFGNSLIRRPVSFQVADPATVFQTLSPTSYSNLELRVALITIDGTIEKLSCSSASVDTTGAIDYSAGDQEITFFTPNDPVFEAVPVLNFC